VFWNLDNVSDCTIAGSNGDNWNLTSSGEGGETTGPITAQTIFTLSCTGLDESSIHESATINILPVFQER
jgi:hypothetical protein